jgi:hypothetical protein
MPGHRWLSQKEAVTREPGREHQALAYALHGHQKGQGPHQMRRYRLEVTSFAQAFAHQGEFQVPQIAQATMRQLGIMRRGGGGEISGLDQGHLEPAQGGIARGEAAGGAAADNQKVESFIRETVKGAPHGRES